MIVQAFFPKNRNRWKQYSSWEPEAKEEKRGRGRELDESDEAPAEVQVKRGYSWSQQLGIAIACLLESGKGELVDWVKEVCLCSFGGFVGLFADGALVWIWLDPYYGHWAEAEDY